MKVLYPARILADESFIEWLIKKDKIGSFLQDTLSYNVKPVVHGKRG